MPLPKLKVPTYTLKLPSTGKVIKFRPFLVKEEKILMMAAESEDQVAILNAVKQIANNCLFGQLDIDNLPIFDLEYIFLRIRAKSVGEEVTFNYRHIDGINNKKEECSHVQEIKLNLEEVEVEQNPLHEKNIKLTDTIGLVLSYPKMTMMEGVDLSNAQEGFELIAKSIEMIYDGDKTYETTDYSEQEMDDFLSSLTQEQFLKITHFFETMPKLRHTFQYKCDKCEQEETVTIEGLESFFG